MSLEKFKELHHQSQPLLIANTWDAISSKAAEKAGFQVIGTSSHAIANILGLEDGEIIPFNEMFFIKTLNNYNTLIYVHIIRYL